MSLDSTKKSEKSARQIVTSHRSQIPKNVSTTAKKIHGSRSHQSEKKAAVAMKSAMKGRCVVIFFTHFIGLNFKLFNFTVIYLWMLIFSPSLLIEGNYLMKQAILPLKLKRY